MSNANDLAFPQPYQSEPGGILFYDVNQGLSKREYFAGLAMQGLLANSGNETYATMAAWAVRHADALIEALNKEPK